MRLIVWDFDGTLACRDGMWTGALSEILAAWAPDLGDRREMIQAELQSGFPWHTPEVSHTELSDPDRWWEALRPVFVRAFRAAGAEAKLADSCAGAVRSRYCDPRSWSVFPDRFHALRGLTEEGWSHVILSNHVPELNSIVRHLDLERFFIRVVSSAVIGHEKPNPMSYREAVSGFRDLEDV